MRRRRFELGLTQEEVAARSGLSIRAISDIERGRTPRPRRSSTSLLAGVLGLDEPTYVDEESEADDTETADYGPGHVMPRQLPAMTVQFVGRAAEIAALNNLLDQLETGGQLAAAAAISGTAGVGKTALTVRWAHQIADRFPDGQLYMDLRGFGPGNLVNQADALSGFLEALGVPPARIPVQAEARVGLYRSLMADRRMLVLLDNAADADHVACLLPGSPGSLTLVTSRNPLTGLAVTHGAHLVPLNVLTAADARDLLAVRLGAERLAAEPAATQALIELTAGLPLALSIAAARATAHPTFPLAMLAAELRDTRGCLEALAGGDPSADVRAAISWSYRRLSEPTARMFRLLGVHPGPDVSVAAAASLCGAATTAARRMLAELVAGGLVSEHAPGRFACHDLLRAYAVEVGQDRDSAADRRQSLTRLLDHYLHTAYAAMVFAYPATEPMPLGPPSSGVQIGGFGTTVEAVAWLNAEYDVMLAACDTAARDRFYSHAWRLPLVVVPFLSKSRHWLGWIAALRNSLVAAQQTHDKRAEAWVHRRLGQAHAFIGNFDEATPSMKTALRTFCRLGDWLSLAHTYVVAAGLREKQQCFRASLHLARRALALFRDCGDQPGEALALNEIGWVQIHLGDYAAALANSREALRLGRGVGDRTLVAATWDSLGLAYFRLGRCAEAISCYEQAISDFLESGQMVAAAVSFDGIGDVHRQIGDLQAAADAWQRALDVRADMHDPAADRTRAKLRSIQRLAATPTAFAA